MVLAAARIIVFLVVVAALLPPGREVLDDLAGDLMAGLHRSMNAADRADAKGTIGVAAKQRNGVDNDASEVMGYVAVLH